MRASSSVSMRESYARWIFWNLSLASSAFSGCLSGCHSLAILLHEQTTGKEHVKSMRNLQITAPASD